jgi:hypothetical protein
VKAGWLVVFDVFPVCPDHPLFHCFGQPANQPTSLQAKAIAAQLM